MPQTVLELKGPIFVHLLTGICGNSYYFKQIQTLLELKGPIFVHLLSGICGSLYYFKHMPRA
jgi:hypothetical protein